MQNGESMSFAKLESVKCACGHEFEVELLNSICVGENPELKDALLCGEINIVQCPDCKSIFYAEQFLLYQESARELVAFVYPESFKDNAQRLALNMRGTFKQAVGALDDESKINYEPILVFGLDSLVEIVRLEDDIKDEIEILRYYADEIGVSTIELSWAYARENKIVPLLPLKNAKGALQRTSVIDGIKILLNKNPNLENYRKTLSKIETDTNWNFDQSKVVKNRKHNR